MSQHSELETLFAADLAPAQCLAAEQALLDVPAGHELLTTVDALVAGVHFLADTEPAAVGHKALAVNLSDLAAMGAEPVGVTLALMLPRADRTWVSDFRAGMLALAKHWRTALLAVRIGRGPLAVTMAAYGLAPAGASLRRDGAGPGDWIYVTGSLGDAGLALQRRLAGVPAGETETIDQRLDRPQPRVSAGLALRGMASAAIDVSDGLIADLGHVLDASGVGARVNVDSLPLSPALQGCGEVDRIRRLALTAGDDYELCFTVPAQRVAQLEQVCARSTVPFTRIGAIESDPGLRLVDRQGAAMAVDGHGYEHFVSPAQT